MISKTQVNKRIQRKNSLELIRTMELAKKNNLLELCQKLSVPTRLQKSINVGQLNEISEKNVIVIGKILGEGDISKKISVAALGFSEQAKDKLTKAGCEIKTIRQEIESNKTLKGVKII